MSLGINPRIQSKMNCESMSIWVYSNLWEVDTTSKVGLCMNQMRVHLTHRHVFPSAARNSYDGS
jgi:hypothetical protein